MKNKNKKSEHRYKLYAFYALLSVFVFFGCLANMLLQRELNGDERPIWFLITAITMLIMITMWTLLIRYLLKEQKKKNSERARVQEYKYQREKDKLSSGFLEGEGDIAYLIEIQLSEFQKDNTDLGELWYKQRQYRKKIEIDAFCLMNDSIQNSCDLDTESETIKTYFDSTIKYFVNENIKCDFLNCAYIFITDNLDEEQIGFYKNFIGLWNCEMENNKFLKNQFFNYCCIEKNTKKIVYFTPSRLDEGDEADLSYMISENLKVKEQVGM